jgi:hypothetical protein
MTIYRHRISGPGSAGDMWTSTLHSNSSQSLATVHAAWQTLVTGFITATLAAMWPNEVSATSIVTDQLDPLTGKNVAQLSAAIAGVGTGAGATMSPRLALVIGHRTTIPTRSGRGRMFWPAPDATHTSASGNLLSTDATTIATSWSGRLTTFKATSQPVIYHRDTHTFDNIVGVTVGVVFGSQRRRTNRVQNAYSTGTV